MPTYTVKKGDTVWSLTSRALEARTGKKPTNAEIQRMVGRVSTPSGNRDQIKPGQKITIPVSSKPPVGSGGRSSAARDERAQQPAPSRRAGSDDASTAPRARPRPGSSSRSAGDERAQTPRNRRAASDERAQSTTKKATSGRNAGPRRSPAPAAKKATSGRNAGPRRSPPPQRGRTLPATPGSARKRTLPSTGTGNARRLPYITSRASSARPTTRRNVGR